MQIWMVVFFFSDQSNPLKELQARHEVLNLPVLPQKWLTLVIKIEPPAYKHQGLLIQDLSMQMALPQKLFKQMALPQKVFKRLY